MINWDRCNESCNNLDDTSSRTSASNKTKDVNLGVFNMITRTNESKTLIKYISFKCKCKFIGRKCIQIKSGMKNCVDVSANIRKNIFVCEKIYIWNLSTCTCENGKYLESIIGDSEITCDEIIEATKTIRTKKIRQKPF